MTPKIASIIDRALEEIRAELIAEARLTLAGLLGDDPPRPVSPLRTANVQGKRLADGRVRRSPEELERLMGRIVAYVKKHPGSRAENISRELGVPSAGLAGPIAQLLKSRALTKKGARRATSYTVK